MKRRQTRNPDVTHNVAADALSHLPRISPKEESNVIDIDEEFNARW